MDHNQWWLLNSGVHEDSATIDIHRFGLQMLAEAGPYDYLELGNVAALEVVMRQVHLVEYHLVYGIGDDNASNAAGVAKRYLGLADHTNAFNGLSPEEGTVMCAPELKEFVHGAVSKGQNELKQLRKGREESDALQKLLGKGGGRGKKK